MSIHRFHRSALGAFLRSPLGVRGYPAVGEYLGAFEDEKLYIVSNYKTGMPKTLKTSLSGTTVTQYMQHRRMDNDVQYILRYSPGFTLDVWKSADLWDSLTVYSNPFGFSTGFSRTWMTAFLPNDSAFMLIDHTTLKNIKLATAVNGAYGTVYTYPAEDENGSEVVRSCGLYGSTAFFLSTYGWNGTGYNKIINVVYTTNGSSFNKVNIATISPYYSAANTPRFFSYGGYLYVTFRLRVTDGGSYVTKLYRSTDLSSWSFVGDMDVSTSTPLIVLSGGNLLSSQSTTDWRLFTAASDYLSSSEVSSVRPNWDTEAFSSLIEEGVDYISTTDDDAVYSLDGGETWIDCNPHGYGLLFRP